uniref:Protein kinase domain-containing protein n=1 Tax=Panagrolaimus sp. JU765 TaxID=591449 RepID=A0AC34REZ7_9BILA
MADELLTADFIEEPFTEIKFEKAKIYSQPTHGPLRKSIPCMHIMTAITCCLLNFALPGSGTILSAFTVWHKDTKSQFCLLSTDNLHNRFVPLEMIGQGGFGQIFKGMDNKTKKLVAIKVEHKYNNDPNNDPRRLVIEHEVLIGLRGKPHIPLIYATGKTIRENPYIVMQILGENLTTLRKQRTESKFSLETSFRIGQQICNALESLHELGFVHRDIKPNNCCIGKEQKKIIYLLDFGMCRRWKINGKPRNARDKAPFRGTIRYASSRALKQKECGPVDDLIGWLYSVLELYLGHLPWAKVADVNEIIRMKLEITPDELCKNIPTPFKIALEYSLSLNFDTMPDYPKIHKLFKECFPENFNPSIPFDWEIK